METAAEIMEQLEVAPAGLRELDAVVAAVQKRKAQFLLQKPETAADGLLAHVKLLRGQRDVLRSGGGEEAYDVLILQETVPPF